MHFAYCLSAIERVGAYPLFGLSGQISFKKFLSAGLTAGGLVRYAQRGCRQKWAADKTLLLNGGDEPVIGLAADIGASGGRAFYGGDEMRIARLVHAQTPAVTVGRDGNRNELCVVRK
jgi:hypothetical protein